MLNLTGYPQIAAIATGSPAERARMRAGDDLLPIDEAGTFELLAVSPDKALVVDELEQKLKGRTVSTATIGGNFATGQ